jgi:hypothetical protein
VSDGDGGHGCESVPRDHQLNFHGHLPQLKRENKKKNTQIVIKYMKLIK